jgi:hypothetical protein
MQEPKKVDGHNLYFRFVKLARQVDAQKITIHEYYIHKIGLFVFLAAS